MKVKNIKSIKEAPAKKTAPKDPEAAVPSEKVPGTHTEKQVLPADDTRLNGGLVEKKLDAALKRALLAKHTGTQRDDIWFLGPAGTGKTDRINYWADGHNYKGMKINLVQWTTAVKSPTDMSGLLFKGQKDVIDPETGEHTKVDRAMALSFEFFDKLDEPNTVLFLDEYNAGAFFTRNALMKLFNEHAIEDNAGNKRYFKNLLFTVVATNKATGNYANLKGMSNAEKSRLHRIPVPYDKKEFLDYLEKQFKQIIQNNLNKAKEGNSDFTPEEIDKLKTGFEDAYEWGKALLTPITGPNGKKVVSLEFDSEDDETHGNEKHGDDYTNLTYRTLSNLLTAAALEDDINVIVDQWDEYCNPDKKETVKLIIDNYKKNFQTSKNKANDAMNRADAESQSANKNAKYADKIRSLRGV